jgi:hexosaminidase
MSLFKSITLRKISPLTIRLTAFLLVCTSFTAEAQFHIIPQPAKISAQSGHFILHTGAIISVDEGSKLTGIYLQSYLAQNYGLHVKVKLKPTLATVRLITDSSGIKGAYDLNVSRARIKIRGNAEGVFYGVQSLIQLLPPGKGKIPLRVPSCSIADAPRFAWRGLSLDVSRHFFNVDEVKKYIDMMAHYKLNVLHWHLTDDEGWRIQIDRYPKLTEIGSRVSDYAKTGQYRPLTNLVGGGSDGFYTKDEIRDVLKYAAERFVTILPEIEMPGHSEAAVFSYPELGCQDSTGAKHRVEMLDPSENTFTFYENVLTEVMELFPNPYIHIGGDEVEMDQWLKSPVAVALMKKEGLKNVREVQSYFIKRIEKFLISKNKKLVGWDEILEGGLAESATVMSWRGEAGGIAAAKMHHHVVMTPLPYMYFDAPQGNETLEPIGWNPTVPWQMVYNYEPLSKQLTEEEAKYIIGVQGNIWTEKIPTPQHLEYMVFPRALATAELGWSPGESKDISRFGANMNYQYGFFKMWGLNACLPYIDSIPSTVTNHDNYTLSLKYPLNGAQVRYSLNGEMPDSTDDATVFPVKKVLPLTDSIKLATLTSWTLNNQRIKQIAAIKHVNINPVEPKRDLIQGLNYEVYKTTRNYNRLDTLKPSVSGVLSFPQQVLRAPEGLNTWVKITGFIKIMEEGDYELTSGFEYSPALLIDNVPVMTIGKNRYSEPQQALLHLKKGYYSLNAYYQADEYNTSQDFIRLKSVKGKVFEPSEYLYH